MPARTTKTSKKATAVRNAYAARTGMDKRSAKILVAAHIVKPETFADEQGNVIRAWKSAEMSSVLQRRRRLDPAQPSCSRTR